MAATGPPTGPTLPWPWANFDGRKIPFTDAEVRHICTPLNLPAFEDRSLAHPASTMTMLEVIRIAALFGRGNMGQPLGGLPTFDLQRVWSEQFGAVRLLEWYVGAQRDDGCINAESLTPGVRFIGDQSVPVGPLLYALWHLNIGSDPPRAHGRSDIHVSQAYVPSILWLWNRGASFGSVAKLRVKSQTMLTAKAFTHGLPEALITDLLGQVDPIILSGNPQYPLLWIALEFGYLAVAKRMVLRGTPFQTSTILLYTDLSHPAVDSFVDWAGSLCEVRSTFLSTILLATQATARLDTSGGAGGGRLWPFLRGDLFVSTRHLIARYLGVEVGQRAHRIHRAHQLMAPIRAHRDTRTEILHRLASEHHIIRHASQLTAPLYRRFPSFPDRELVDSLTPPGLVELVTQTFGQPVDPLTLTPLVLEAAAET